ADERAERIGCWQSMSGCERDDQIAIANYQRACNRDQPAIRSACKIGHGALDVFAVLPTERAHLHLKQPRSGLGRTELADTRSSRGFSNDSDTRHIRRDLLAQL